MAAGQKNSDLSDLFTYIDSGGNLVLQNVKDQTQKVIMAGEDIHDYDYYREKGLLAYIRNNAEEESREFVLYHEGDEISEKILADEFASSVSWSPGGKYLLLDSGTSAHRSIRIVNMETGTQVEVNGIISYLWSPGGTVLALGVAEEVEPATPVEDGKTYTTAVMYLEKEKHIKTIVKGTSDFSTTPLLWLDQDTLVVVKRNYMDYLNEVYLKSQIQQVNVSEIPKTELPPDKRESFPAETVSTYHSISADGNMVLSSFYNEKAETLEVMLYDRRSGNKLSLGAGEKAKWVLQAR